MQIVPQRSPEGRPLVVIAAAAEAADAIGVMRNLKKAFPKEFQSIAMEIELEEKPGLLLPEGAAPVNRINGHAAG